MSKVFAISDHHFGHKDILDFEGLNRNFGKLASVDQHDDWLVEQHNAVCTKSDVIYFLGDVCVDMDRLDTHVKHMVGRKHLILGNHDRYDDVSMAQYKQVFETVKPIGRWKGWIMTHIPIHPQEIKVSRSWVRNLHGHLHSAMIDDPLYENCCIEHSNGYPVELSRATL